MVIMMSKRVAIVENCKECPFLELPNLSESKCNKLRLTGKISDLWNACPLPNHCGSVTATIQDYGNIKKGRG